MIAGGYAAAYEFSDPSVKLASTKTDFDVSKLANPRGETEGGEDVSSQPRIDRNKRQTQKLFGGLALRRAWMYDGIYWANIADMSEVRDRPACSLVELPDGHIRILVAGGCNGWCVENPAEATAEMYNPETDLWTRVADLPKPLHSAKMELLEGLPTIVGGYDNTNQNDVLYQYHPDIDQWKPHPIAKMRIARSSATVFQVPRGIFKHC